MRAVCDKYGALLILDEVVSRPKVDTDIWGPLNLTPFTHWLLPGNVKDRVFQQLLHLTQC